MGRQEASVNQEEPKRERILKLKGENIEQKIQKIKRGNLNTSLDPKQTNEQLKSYK